MTNPGIREGQVVMPVAQMHNLPTEGTNTMNDKVPEKTSYRPGHHSSSVQLPEFHYV